MSRCLPFPPPGYVRIVATGDSLIDSIKPQKEKEKAQTDRERESKTENKDPKTEKKEFRKEKKEKDKNGEKKEKKQKRREKHGDRSESKKSKISDIFREVKKNQLDPKEKSLLQKKPEDVAEQLEKSEKSCLTEEHQQLNLTNLCYSSDGTQSGDKRKRDSLPSTSNQSNGSIIRIRMSTSKQKIAEAPLSQGQECAKSVKVNPSGITKLPVQKQSAPASIPATIATKEVTCQPDLVLLPSTSQKQYASAFIPATIATKEVTCQPDLVLLPSTSQKQYASAFIPATIATKDVTRQPDLELLPSTSGKNKSLPSDSLKTSSKSKSADKKLLKKEKLYKALTLNWVPIPLIHDQVVADEDDQDWLFKSKSGDDHAAKRLKACNDSPFEDGGSYGYGPRACHLPEVDIYALPYVMPY